MPYLLTTVAAVGLLLADDANPLSGNSGLLGTGVLGVVLGWLLWVHLPAKDRQLKEVIADKDAQLTAKDVTLKTYLDAKDERYRSIIESKDAALSKQAEYHKGVVEAVVKNCDEQSKAERAGVDRRFAEFLVEDKAQFKDMISLQNKSLERIGEAVHAVRNLANAWQLRTQLADAMVSMDVANWCKSPDGEVISWNQAAERLLGWKQGEVVGTSLYDRIVPVDKHAEEKEVLRRIQAGEEVEEYESVRMNRHRQRVRVLLKTSGVRTREGKVIAASTLARPVPEES